VFSRRSSGYLWTDVNLSGTIDEPRQDLSQRIIELFKESPALISVIFRQFGDWLKKTFGTNSQCVELTLPPINQSLISDLPASDLWPLLLQHANAFVDKWQTDRQGKTFALALDGELASVLAHDTAHNQQSKPTAGWFGCEIRPNTRLKFSADIPPPVSTNRTITCVSARSVRMRNVPWRCMASTLFLITL